MEGATEDAHLTEFIEKAKPPAPPVEETKQAEENKAAPSQAAPATTQATPATTQTAPATTQAAPATTQTAPAITKAKNNQVAPTLFEDVKSTTT